MSSSSSTPSGRRSVMVVAVEAKRLALAVLDAVEGRPSAMRRIGGTARPSASSLAANQSTPSWSISSNGPNFQL